MARSRRSSTVKISRLLSKDVADAVIADCWFLCRRLRSIMAPCGSMDLLCVHEVLLPLSARPLTRNAVRGRRPLVDGRGAEPNLRAHIQLGSGRSSQSGRSAGLGGVGCAAVVGGSGIDGRGCCEATK